MYKLTSGDTIDDIVGSNKSCPFSPLRRVEISNRSDCDYIRSHQIPDEGASDHDIGHRRADKPNDDDLLELLELYEFMPPVYCDGRS